MKSEPNKANLASSAALGYLLAALLFLALGVAAKIFLRPTAVDADRGGERARALAEIRAAEEISLNTAGWIDQSRGIVRLPIETAMQLAAEAGQNPAQARADLIARQKKAGAPAPAAPTKPSAFE
jgi:hypothetical protein